MAKFSSARSTRILLYTAWALLGLETVLSLGALGVTASVAAAMKNDLLCSSVPGKLSYNIAAAALTFVVGTGILAMTVVSYIRTRRAQNSASSLRRIALLTFGAAALFTLLWAAALGTSFYSCNDICNACADGLPSWIVLDQKCCVCPEGTGDNSLDCANIDIGDGEDLQQIASENPIGLYGDTQALDGVVLGLSFISLVVATLLWRFRHERRDMPVYNLSTSHELPKQTSTEHPRHPPPTYEQQMQE